MSKSHHLKTTIRRDVPVQKTARVLQIGGLFDVPPTERVEHTCEVLLPLPDEWNVGLIVGPSGCGKSTVAREFWPEHLAAAYEWPADKSILDGFPAVMSIKDITGLLCSVGFSSPPSWMKPFRVLSNGEQFRVTMARPMSEQPDLAVIDEFTSVVDRDVAKIASAAVQKAIRRRGQKFIAVSCHHDIAEWLEPDWIYQPHTGEFVAGRLLQRPPIELEIRRVHHRAWELFKSHHYLSADIHRSARCFIGFWRDRPAAFCAVLSFPHSVRPGWREHRAVCLPDYQGVGIGTALGEYVAGLFQTTGKPYRSTTSHPGYRAHRLRSSLWKMTRAPLLTKTNKGARGLAALLDLTAASNRLVSSFEYIGPANPTDARRFGII